MTNALGLGIVLSLQDKVSAGLAKVQQGLLSFKNVSAEMVSQFDAGARQMMGGFMLMRSGVGLISSFDNMFGRSVDFARSFQMAMARVQAVSGATGETFKALENQAREFGANTRFTIVLCYDSPANSSGLEDWNFKTIAFKCIINNWVARQTIIF